MKFTPPPQKKTPKKPSCISYDTLERTASRSITYI